MICKLKLIFIVVVVTKCGKSAPSSISSEYTNDPNVGVRTKRSADLIDFLSNMLAEHDNINDDGDGSNGEWEDFYQTLNNEHENSQSDYDNHLMDYNDHSIGSAKSENYKNYNPMLSQDYSCPEEESDEITPPDELSYQFHKTPITRNLNSDYGGTFEPYNAGRRDSHRNRNMFEYNNYGSGNEILPTQRNIELEESISKNKFETSCRAPGQLTPPVRNYVPQGKKWINTDSNFDRKSKNINIFKCFAEPHQKDDADDRVVNKRKHVDSDDQYFIFLIKKYSAIGGRRKDNRPNTRDWHADRNPGTPVTSNTVTKSPFANRKKNTKIPTSHRTDFDTSSCECDCNEYVGNDQTFPNTPFPDYQTTESQATKRRSTKSRRTESQTTESQTTESQTTESQTTESETTESQATETEPIESQPTESSTIKYSSTKSYLNKTQTTKATDKTINKHGVLNESSPTTKNSTPKNQLAGGQSTKNQTTKKPSTGIQPTKSVPNKSPTTKKQPTPSVATKSKPTKGPSKPASKAIPGKPIKKQALTDQLTRIETSETLEEDLTGNSEDIALTDPSAHSEAAETLEEDLTGNPGDVILTDPSAHSETTETLEDLTSNPGDDVLTDPSAHGEAAETLEELTSNPGDVTLTDPSAHGEAAETLEDLTSNPGDVILLDPSAHGEAAETLEDLTSNPGDVTLTDPSAHSEITETLEEDITSNPKDTTLTDPSAHSETTETLEEHLIDSGEHTTIPTQYLSTTNSITTNSSLNVDVE